MRKVLAMALLFGVSNTALAFEWKNLWQRPDERGATHLANKRYKQAAEEFTSIPWRGVAYYRDADYVQAEQSFLQDKTPSGHFNRGNALALQAKYQEAIAAYDSALAIDPKMKKAHDAREIVMKLLEKQKQENQPKKEDQQKQPENKPQDQQQQQGENKSPDQSEQNKQQPSPDKSDKEKEQQSQQSDNGKQQDPDKGNTKDNQKPDKQNPQLGDKDQQQAKTEPGKDQPDQKSQNKQQHADQQEGKEAQPKPQQQSKSGEQKQQNSKVARDDKTKNEDSVPEAQEKDKPVNAQPGKPDDQATQQWLQQVPDDPAGLLRRKFLRDHQQRLMEQRG